MMILPLLICIALKVLCTPEGSGGDFIFPDICGTINVVCFTSRQALFRRRGGQRMQKLKWRESLAGKILILTLVIAAASAFFYWIVADDWNYTAETTSPVGFGGMDGGRGGGRGEGQGQ